MLSFFYPLLVDGLTRDDIIIESGDIDDVDLVLLLGIGAYVLLNANNTELQATSPITEQPTTFKRNRHTIVIPINFRAF